MAKDNAQALEGQRYGDLQYNRGHTYWDVLHPGTSGQVLQTQGRDKPPKWGIAKLCYDAVVDPAGTGTHTTIQSALDSVKNTNNAHVLVFGGTYAEAIVPTAGTSTRITVEGCPTEADYWMSADSAIPLNGTNLVGIGSGIVLDLRSSTATDWIFQGLAITSAVGTSVESSASNVSVSFFDCQIYHGITGSPAIVIPDTSGAGGGRIQLVRCFVRAASTDYALKYTGTQTALTLLIEDCNIQGPVDIDGTTSGTLIAHHSKFKGTGAAASIKAATCVVDGSIISADTGVAINCTKTGSVSNYFSITDNSIINDTTATPAIQLVTGGDGVIEGNRFVANVQKFAVAINIGAGVTAYVLGNDYAGALVSIIGTVTNLDPLESAGTALSHNILSTTHGDTVAGSVVAGDLAYGNSTPKWDRLPKGTNGQVLQMATGLPAWGAPLAAASVFYIPFGSEAAIGEAYTP